MSSSDNPKYPSDELTAERKDPTTFAKWQWNQGSHVWAEKLDDQVRMWKESLDEPT